MNYKDVFSIDEVFYNKIENIDIQKYRLNNFSFLEPKLEKDFYLKYFIREILIEIDILEVEDFLEYQYGKSKDPKLFLKTLKLKIVTEAKSILKQAEPYNFDSPYSKSSFIEYDFIEINDVVFKPMLESRSIGSFIELHSLHEDLKGRINIIEIFLEENSLEKTHSQFMALKWKGKPSHLAYFIAQCIEEGYIEAPIKRNGDLNIQELSKRILESFDFGSGKPSIETLKKYCNSDTDKYIKLNERFVNHGFHLPNSKILS